jgi:hypothetical protein
VVAVRTPTEAIVEVERAPEGPLTVVTDFNLKAAQNGLQLLAAVRASLEQLGDVHEGGDADAFLEKPLLLDDLVKPLAKLIEQRFA